MKQRAWQSISRFGCAALLVAGVVVCGSLLDEPAATPPSIVLTNQPGDNGSDDSGSSGDSGTSGNTTSGNTTTGNTTSTGDTTTGDTGTTGNTGSTGDTGTTGDSGTTGDPGTSGDTGTSGDPGTSGDTGTSGDPNTTGDTGTTGNTGSTGDTGTTGDPNTSGDTSTTGNPSTSGGTNTSGGGGTPVQGGNGSSNEGSWTTPVNPVTPSTPVATVVQGPLPLVAGPVSFLAPTQPGPVPTLWAALLPTAGPWTSAPSAPPQVPLTPLEVMAGGVDLPPTAGNSATKANSEAWVTPFVAPEIRSNGSPDGGKRSDQLVLTAAFIGALALGVVALVGWRRNRVGWH